MAEPRLSALVDQRLSVIPDYVACCVCVLTRIDQARQLPEMAREVFGLLFSHMEELGSVYQKLGVNSRFEAVRRAKEFSLV